MKNKQEELNVDFIGGARPLTKEDEIAISNYIRAYKAKHSHSLLRKKKKQAITKRRSKTTSKKKVVV